MRVINTKEPIVLLIGDICALVLALWLSLFIRTLELPTGEIWQLHFYPFLIIFFLWIAIFYLSGLYERHTAILKNKISSILFNSYAISSFVAVMFFYIIPIFAITPKTILFLFILISFFLSYFFRVIFYSKIFSTKKNQAILIGEGDAIDALYNEVNTDKHYALQFVYYLKPSSPIEELQNQIEALQNNTEVSVVVIDFQNKNIAPLLPKLYSLLLKDKKFFDSHQVYEEVFYKVPLSLLGHDWFIKNISTNTKFIYDFVKRMIDVSVSLIGGLFTLALYPFIILAMKIEDPKGSIFISQIRVGKNNKLIKIYKFRSMQKNENGVWLGESENKITKVGAFLRKSSVDEFPQFWSIFKGDLSLVGPRPDMTGLEERLSTEISYYAMRYIVKPGLSGWAQTRQDVIPNTISENKERLAYDLFYIKNRSILLDIKIILKTIKTLLTRGGR